MSSFSSIAHMEFPIFLGCEEDFDLVFRTYHQPLLHYARKFVDAEDADDLVENLFMKLWQKNPELSSEAHLRNYLYLSLKNSCLDYQKTRAKQDVRYQQVIFDTELTERSHIEQLIGAEILAEVYRAIHHLPLAVFKGDQCQLHLRKEQRGNSRRTGAFRTDGKNQKVKGLKLLKQRLSGETKCLSFC